MRKSKSILIHTHGIIYNISNIFNFQIKWYVSFMIAPWNQVSLIRNMF